MIANDVNDVNKINEVNEITRLLMNKLTPIIKSCYQIAVLVIMLLVSIVTVNAQQNGQGGTVTYGYDANGRLTSVTLPTGEGVIYTYDPAGNITSIQRIAGPGPQFISFTPQSGFIGDTVTFTGVNFGSITSVSFNGTNATVFAGNLAQITATVPENASSGPITVTLANGTFTTSTFTVLAIQITPSQASVFPNQTQQFTANVPSQLGNNSVTWAVNGVNGGNSSVGTISNTGLYIAPNITSTQTFTIRATSTARPELFAQAQIRVSPDLFQARNAVSVLYKQGFTINQTNVSSLSIQNGDFITRSQNFYPTTGVSVVHGDLTTQLQNFYPTTGVSVVHGELNTQIQNYYSSNNVSVTNSPVINSITPNTLARNSNNSITINGTNLSGTTTLVFINDSNGQIDTNITASNITVAGDGNSLTATINVTNTALTGNRVVVISGALTGHSVTNNQTNNIITITP